MEPPTSPKAPLSERKRPRAFAIEKLTRPLGEPEAPALVAKRLTVVAGQYQPSLGAGQAGSAPERGAGKKSPFEPVSRKPPRLAPSKLVRMSPVRG
jgi:hypothetical protein